MIRRGPSFEFSCAVGFLGTQALLLAVLLFLTHGHFAYSLDDPYIHLAFAEGLRDGHFGLHPSETSSPSSSVLWPLLLSCFAPVEHFVWVPLLLNLASTTAVVVLLARHVEQLLPDARRTTHFGLMAILALGTNLVGMPINGMEHSLQLLATTVACLGVLRFAGRGTVGVAFVAALVLGPLIRFENTSLLVMGVWVLARGGRRGTAAGTMLLGGALLCAVLATHRAQGLGWLPSSVLVKSEVVNSIGSRFVVLELLENIGEGLVKSRMLAVWVPLVLFFRARRRRRVAASETSAVFLAGIVVAHLAAGRYDWYGRYEVYVLIAAAIVLPHLYRDRIRELLRKRTLRPLAAFGAAVLLLCHNQVHASLTSPWSARDVYEMHGQMNRIVTEHWRGPVGTNDIGWVSFRNPHYVLDLWGLGSEEARELRQEAGDNEWIEVLADRRGVALLMIFDAWFLKKGPLPENWERVATLRLSSPPIQVAQRELDFYCRDPEREGEVREALLGARAGLPEGVELLLHGELVASAVRAGSAVD